MAHTATAIPGGFGATVPGLAGRRLPNADA